MQRWKCAVGAVVLLAVAGGSVVACGKSGNTKQNAAQAKAKPKGDPKSAKADAKTAKTDPKAAKADPKAAKADPNAAKADPKAAKPAQTAANAKPATPAPAQKPTQTAAKTTPAAPAPTPAQKTTAANTKPAAPAQAAANTKPAAPAQTTAAAKTPAAPVEQTTASSELQQSLTNKTLVAQLQSRLPAGTDVLKASMGFRNLTQFVSAVHASHNLSIPFDKMRTAMVDEKKSLSNAIRALKPTATATIEAQRADYEARGTIYQAQHPDTPATDAPAKKAKPATQ